MATSAQPAIAQLNVNEAWCEALFASALQPWHSSTADLVAGAISCAVGQIGGRGRAGWMAQEFGDHPTQPPAGCAGCASSPRPREAEDERDL